MDDGRDVFGETRERIERRLKASGLFEPEERDRRLRNVAHALAMILLAMAFAVVALSLAFAAAALLDVSREGTAWSVTLYVVQFLGFLLAFALYVREADEIELVNWRMPTLRDAGWVAGGFVVLYVVAYLSSVIVQLLGARTATNQVVEQGQNDPELFLYMIPITILLVAPAEELVFRGVVQGLLRRAYGILPGLVLASVLFGAVHVVALTGDGKLAYLIVAMGLGLVLGAVYEVTENIVVPMGVHAVWNTLLFVSQWYITTNPEVVPS